MTFVPGTRMLSEISFFYLLALLFPLNLTWPMLLGAMLLCAMGCNLSVFVRNKTALRCLCALLPLAVGLIPGETPARICLGIPALYSVVLIVSDHVHTDSWNYSRHFRFSLVFGLLLMVLGCSLKKERTAFFAVFGTMYLVFGAYFLRQLRLGGGVSLRGRIRDLAAISALPLGAGTVSLLIFEGMEPISHVVMAIVAFFGGILNVIVTLATKLYVNVPTEVQAATNFTHAPTEAPEWEELVEETAQHLFDDVTLSPTVFRTILVAAALALIGLLLFGVSRFSRRPTVAMAEGSWTEADGMIAEVPVSVVRKAESNRRKVRKAYSSYLHLLQGKGMFRRRTDTSQDVLDASTAYADPQDSSDLRKIYIRARYHMDQPVTDEDVQEAGKILKELRKNL